MFSGRRILIQFASFLGLVLAYFAYTQVLGGVDGLTPLPQQYWPTDKPPPAIVMAPNSADLKLQQAFGEACPELQRNYKLLLRDRTMVLAADNIEVDKGDVLVSTLSLAIFKADPQGRFPDINTVASRSARVEFDKPIQQLSEIAERKVVGAQLGEGDILLTNNRKTLPRDDDLLVHTKGIMYYDAAKHYIWTDSEVELTDLQSKPEPMKVTARGLDVYLAVDSNASAKSGQKAKDNITGVERLCLRNTVRMDLWVDGKAGFLAASPSAKDSTTSASSSAPAGPAAEKSKLVVTTSGPFSFDCRTNLARFEIPYGHSRYPENVEVIRLHEQGKLDHLLCDCLEIQFQKRTGPAPSDSTGGGLEIKSAHAFGKTIVLTSDSEQLIAWGNDLEYDAGKHRTVLRGSPEMIASRQGNEIYARELWLDAAEKKEEQTAIAKGPGHIHLLDQDNGQRNVQAHWNDTLEYKKDGAYDCLTLTGAATFEDKEHAQRMQADRLRVWLEQGKAGDSASRARPHHLDAKGHVTADSPDLVIKGPTDNLTVWFKDVPHGTLPVADKPPSTPATAPIAVPSNPAKTVAFEKSAKTGSAGGTLGGLPLPARPDPNNPAAKPKPPMELSARGVTAYVIRDGTKSDLDQLACEGSVHVHQDPTGPDDRGTDIKGDILQLSHHADGAILIVNGNLAQVQFDKLAILGPEVNIDQRGNTAWVNGAGAMRILTDTNFEGAKLPHPTELLIHWKESMYFDGRRAEFRRGVQAEQQTSRLLCENLQVSFDRPISLKEGEKNGARAKVDKLVCDQSVQMEELVREGGKLVSYKRLVAPEVAIDNTDGTANVPGPGEVRTIQLSTGDGPLASSPTRGQKASPANRNAKPEPELTHVRFAGRMQVNNRQRTAYFYDHVEVIHVPSDQPDLKVDIDHPPPGCMYMRSEKLHVFTRVLPNGTKSQEMEAYRKVYVQAQEFSGNADVVKYDEAEDRIIFEAAEGSRVTLYRVRTPGSPPEKLIGKKIYYWRKTNTFKVEQGGTIDVAN
jgi:lipopolysaccharide export system protein LptA